MSSSKGEHQDFRDNGGHILEHSKAEIIDVLDQFIHNRQDRKIMTVFLTDYPGSLEKLAAECDVSLSTVKRAVDRCSFVSKYLP